jgi:hypothetical protein
MKYVECRVLVMKRVFNQLSTQTNTTESFVLNLELMQLEIGFEPCK